MIKLDDEMRAHLIELRRKEKNVRQHVKISIILNLDRGLSKTEVAEIFGVDLSTIYRYIADYNVNTFEDFLKDNWVPYKGKASNEQRNEFSNQVTEELYTNAQALVFWLESTMNLIYSVSGVTKLLHALNFSYKKTKLVPSKADPEAQRAYISEFETFMESKSPKTLVFFNDGVHPQHNTRAEHAWIPRGKDYEMPANAGRSRLNITGAINAENPTDFFSVAEDSVNSQSTIQVWEKIELAHPDNDFVQITDNARYYHSKVIKEWLAEHPRTKIKYLPPYSPNLNPIERVWKFMKKQVISSYFYETFAEFKESVMAFLNSFSEYKDKLESLVTLNFRPVESY
jgi:transposase